MKYKIFLLVAIVCFSSCEKSFFGIGGTKAADYMPLEIGNYWIYESSSEAPDGTIHNSHDTIRINKDTIIGDHTYAILEGTKFGLSYRSLLRTQDHRLINSKEQILLNCESSGSTYLDSAYIINEDTVYTVQYNTTKWSEEATLNLHAGSYTDIFVHTRNFTVHQAHDGINESPLTASAFYAKNVGLVKDETFFLNSGLGIKIELLKYGQE